jgi:hypothetical protein
MKGHSSNGNDGKLFFYTLVILLSFFFILCNF